VRTAEAATQSASGTELWSSPEWLATALAWLDEQLHAAGIQRTGSAEQPHLRPWATALRVPTTRGVFWLKAASAGTAFEIRLYPLLRRAAPGWVLEPLAIDLERSWIVLPDGGATLRASVPPARLVPALLQVLPQYAELQRQLSPHAGEMLELGLADMRAQLLPQRFEEGLREASDYTQRLGTPADAELIQRLQAFRGTFCDWCARLEHAPGPASLDHNDLHTGNIFVQDSGATGLTARFYDWGDAVLAHPFASLLVALGEVCQRLQLAPEDAQILRLRDAYLEPFGDLAPHAELVAAVDLSCRGGKVARALTWARALRTLNPEEAQRFAGAPLRWLGFLLDESQLGIGA
jgi:hypothetical protein